MILRTRDGYCAAIGAAVFCACLLLPKFSSRELFGLNAETKTTESNLNKIFALSTIAAAALTGAALLAPAAQAAAKDYAFCRQDYSSDIRSCGFETMEQCVAMISGRGGTCTRDPYVTEKGESYAYAPKGHRRPLR